jgi:hypothetical protein
VYTTLNKIKSHDPCARGWRTLLTALGKTKADDDPVSMAFILQSNGFEDAVWTFKCLAGADREIRLFAVDCARQVQHLMTDPLSLAALDVAERFANGLATSEELDAARAEAWAAADAAWAAAGAAAGAAADAAWAAARAAAWAAARAAAWAAARAAARAAADAAWAAAGAAAGAAAAAAQAEAWAAADAAWAAARAKQEELFLKYFG